jgi:hypothetical protein
MAYLGSTPTTQSFIAGTDSFNGTGSATNFTLSRIVNSVNDVQVVVNNVVQYPPNYSVSGTTLTISPAPSSGTNNVYVRYLSTTLQSVTPPGGTTVNGDWGINGDLDFYGNVRRITGDFSNATFTNRVAFQTSTTGGNTFVHTLPNGTATGSGQFVFNNSDPNNSAFIGIQANGTTDARLISGITGTGTYLPMTFYTAGSERARIDTSGNFQFNSGYGSVATAYGCRAWVNFNGTGTVAIRASGNVSSITDNGTGDYTVNFTNAMPDANYAVNAISQQGSGDAAPNGVVALKNAATITTSAVRLIVGTPTVGANDRDYVFVSIFR